MKKYYEIAALVFIIIAFVSACSLAKPALLTQATPMPAIPVVPALPEPGLPAATILAKPPANSLAISFISDNTGDYAGGEVPRFEKYELTFTLNTSAGNLQWPYDPAPPPGVSPGTGVSVDAIFTSPSNQTYSQPAFYFEDYSIQPDLNGSGQDWIYPSGSSAWKVRFAPNEIGVWHYRLSAQDSSGTISTSPGSFTVTASPDHGFIRVSRDPRYFQFDDGTYFPGLGYNMNFDHISWSSPVTGNASNFRIMGQNGIQLVRMWLSEWSIFGAEWNPWHWINGNPDWHYLDTTISYADSGVSLKLAQAEDACVSEGHWVSAPIAVKPHTNYRVRVRVKTVNLSGPRIAGLPFGFVAKIPGTADSWLWGPGKNCNDAGVGQVVTERLSSDSDWTIVSGSYASGEQSFLPAFYLTLENVKDGSLAYVDHVWMEEDLGDGSYGPNILIKPGMDHHQYFDQRTSFAFDQVVELAHQTGVYLRPVVMEKNDWILDRIDYEGNFVQDDQASNDNFYGNWRSVTKVRWLQQAWWRYLQARWGYSTNIHSWELLNEGDPFSGLHYTLADEFGKTMHQFKPDDHLVSTSNWHSFPGVDFWANSNFPNIDFADVHTYIDDTNQLSLRVNDSDVQVDSSHDINDTAAVTQKLSMLLGAKGVYGAGKPIIRGEIGFVTAQGAAANYLAADTSGIWLHNFIWGGINPGGMIESYWYEQPHIYSSEFDYRSEFGSYYRFIQDIPLTNDHYQDAQARVSAPGLRAWGQKDLVNGRAHLWIQNTAHTWKNLVDGVRIPPLTGTVAISGFQPATSFTAQWWNSYTGAIQDEQTVVSDAQGTITLPILDLTTDTAMKIYPNQ